MFKVVIDAGHGMNTAGKRTPDGEREWSFNNKVAVALEAELKKYEGVSILRVDDRTGKTDVSLSSRTNKANAFDADVYISIHHNANTGKYGTWTGTETFTYSANVAGSERLAKAVHPHVVKAYGLRDRGLKKANFHVLRETKMDAILIEGGYMDSVIDIKKLRSDAVLKNAGIGIALGLAQFASLKKKVVVAPKPVAKPVVSASAKTYTVKAGDTLWGISRDTGVSVANLKAYNKLSSDVISIGQVLNLTNAVYHTVKSGDTLWGISRDYKVAVSQIKSLSGLKSDIIHVGDKLRIK
jgi:N-acetylmuramoyl-L-alanine amidase